MKKLLFPVLIAISATVHGQTTSSKDSIPLFTLTLSVAEWNKVFESVHQSKVISAADAVELMTIMQNNLKPAKQDSTKQKTTK